MGRILSPLRGWTADGGCPHILESKDPPCRKMRDKDGAPAWLDTFLNYAAAMSLTALTVFVLGIAVIPLGRERRGAHFGV